jgi:hypothetical protein
MNWFHKFLNPHCPDCKDDQINIAIETLRSELAAERYNNQLLINALIPKTPEVVETRREQPIEINNRNLPWRVKQQMLEAEDRAKAQTSRRIIEDKKAAEQAAAKSTDELEKELLGDENA